MLAPLMAGGAVKCPGRGRPRVHWARVAGDKGNASGKARRYRRGRRIGAVIPTRKGERPNPRFDRGAYGSATRWSA